MSFNNNTKTDIQIRRFTFRIVIVFLLAITVATGTITLILTRKSSREMKSKVVNLIQANTQLQISNLNQYLGRIEDTAALLFSDDIYCEYDATKEGQDAFEKIQQETAIEKRLQDINILQNFSDFGIVYADDSSLGAISNTTLELFPDGGFLEQITGKQMGHCSCEEIRMVCKTGYDVCHQCNNGVSGGSGKASGVSA